MGTKSVSLHERGARASTPRPPRQTRPLSATQRNKLATHGIATALGVTDEKALATAALEALHERWADDADLRKRVREKYDEIVALSAPTRQKADLGPVPVPIRSGTPAQYSPMSTLDPYQLNWEYGEHQLRAVLQRVTQRSLREATALVKERNPGTKPASASRKQDMIDYVVAHVAGPGY